MGDWENCEREGVDLRGVVERMLPCLRGDDDVIDREDLAEFGRAALAIYKDARAFMDERDAERKRADDAESRLAAVRGMVDSEFKEDGEFPYEVQLARKRWKKKLLATLDGGVEFVRVTIPAEDMSLKAAEEVLWKSMMRLHLRPRDEVLLVKASKP